MKIHHLKIQAFGPFADAQEIDFDALNDAGLFLMHGPTGAGKTSVLDALCFALYGSVPSDRSNDGLRSQHAAPGVVPEVVCDFSVRGTRWRVRRSPAWQRPKQRGNGTTLAQASVTLDKYVQGQWQNLSQRNDEVAHTLGQVLNLSQKHFTLLVMLPQGQFATFLRAPANDRRSILESIFGTERFALAEQWLHGHATELKQRAARAEQSSAEYWARITQMISSAQGRRDATQDEAESWLHRVQLPEVLPADFTSEALHQDVPLDGMQGVEDAAAPSWRGMLTQLGAVLSEAAEHQVATAKEAAERQAEYQTAQKILQLQHEREGLLAEQTALLAQAPLIAERQRQLASAEKVLPLFSLHERVQQRHTLWQQKLSTAGERWSALEDTWVWSNPNWKPEAWQGTKLATTEVWPAPEATLPVQPAADTAEPPTDTAQSYCIALHQQLSELQAGVSAVRSTGADASTLDSPPPALMQAQQELIAATQARQAAVEQLQQLRQRRLDGMAAELAQGLDAAHPCPVCGSADHPHPALPAADPVDADAEQRADAQVRQLETAETEKRDQLSRVQEAHTRAQERAATRAAEARAHLATALASADPAQALALEHRNTLASLRDPDDQALEHAAHQLGGLVTQLTQTVAAWSAFNAQSASAREAQLNWREACNSLNEVATQQYDDLEAARRALQDHADLDSATVDHWRSEAEHHHVSMAKISGRLEAPELQIPQVPTAQEMQQLLATSESAAAQAQAASRRHALVENTRNEVQRLCDELLAHLDAHRPLMAQAQEAIALAECATGRGGDNMRRMPLGAYVLAARLERIASIASEHLQRISQGRFSIEHKATLESHGRKSGLGLQIADNWTGQTRDASTLSGGETFYTSLALALALADVVRAEAGGVTLDTLFIDEGFGTLDEATLEDVMSELDSLRSGGRTVGIVSHVRELTQRISAQVRVQRSSNGSAIQQSS